MEAESWNVVDREGMDETENILQRWMISFHRPPQMERELWRRFDGKMEGRNV